MSSLIPPRCCPPLRARSAALVFAVGIFVSTTICTVAASPGAGAAMAEKPALAVAPWKASFKKEASGKNEAPMVLMLKNDSRQALTVSGTITLSVVVHNRPKSRDLPSQTVAAGAVLTIDNLAPDDKVTLNTAGFAPWMVVVPYKP
jgi:hypothetical protein